MYKIIQCRSTEGSPERCNQLNETGRIKEARGLQKMQFNSHLEMLYTHEMYEYWDEWDVDFDIFMLTAFVGTKMVYSYRVVIDESS